MVKYNALKIVIFLIIVTIFFQLKTVAHAQAITTYYIDCENGSDTNNGISQTTAWKSITKIQSGFNPQPGDKILLKRNCTWTTNSTRFIEIKWKGTQQNPIVISAYGTGENPILKIDAQGANKDFSVIFVTNLAEHIIIENLRVTLENPFLNNKCLWEGKGIPFGYNVGFNIHGRYVTVQNFEADHLAIGVAFSDDSENNKILYGHIHHLNGFWVINQDIGALGVIGINLHGNNHEIGYVLFDNNEAECIVQNTSGRQGDGITPNVGIYQHYSAPFEVYNANNTFVHHNKAFGHRKHFEMGRDSNHTTRNNVLAYNLFVSDEPFAKGPNIHANIRPNGDIDIYGPVEKTYIYNNTIVFTGRNSEAIICACTHEAVVKNNIFIAEEKAAFYRGIVTESNNVYWDYNNIADTTPDPYVQFLDGTISNDSYKADPIFENRLTNNFKLVNSSVAIDKGDNSVLNHLIATKDIEENLIPGGNKLDIGAYEFYPYNENDRNKDGNVNLLDIIHELSTNQNFDIYIILNIIKAIFNR